MVLLAQRAQRDASVASAAWGYRCLVYQMVQCRCRSDAAITSLFHNGRNGSEGTRRLEPHSSRSRKWTLLRLAGADKPACLRECLRRRGGNEGGEGR